MALGYPSRFRFSRLAPLLFVLSLVAAGGLAQDDAKAACPSAGELRAELLLRQEKSLELKARLEDFMAGKSVADVAMAALFMIDPDDPEAVAKRVEDLRQEVSDTTEMARTSDPFIACALASDSLRATAKALLAERKAIAALRLQFLSLPQARRSAILHPQVEAKAQAQTVRQLREERSAALAEQKQAAQSLAHAEQQALTVQDGSLGELAAERAELERSRAQLTVLQVKWISALQQQATYYRQVTERLAATAGFLLQPESSAALDSEYDKAVAIWRDLVDKTRQMVAGPTAWTLPPLPAYPERLLAKIGDTAIAKQYAVAYADAKALRESLQSKIGERLQENADLHYRVLLQSGEIRSQLLNLLLASGSHKPLAFSRDLLQDIRRELAVVPYRWTATFYLRSLALRTRLQQGWEGLAETAANLAVLIALLAIPWGMWGASRRLAVRLNRLRLDLVRQSRTRPWTAHLALTIQKLVPYSAWLVMLLALHITQKLLDLTVFAELALFLVCLRYYVYYRVFRQLMQCDFLWVSQQIRAAKLWNLRRQVDWVVRILGVSGLLMFTLLAAIEALIRRGLIYHLATMILLDLGLLIAMGLAFQWRRIIGTGLEKFMPAGLGQYASKACQGGWGLLLSVPAFVLLMLLLILRQIGRWSSHFELTKRIAAEVFRYQLESAIDKTDTPEQALPPEEYRAAFALSGLAEPAQLVQPAVADLDEIRGVIGGWAAGTGRLQSLAIVGYKGSGKTCLLDFLQRNAPVAGVVRAAVPPKLITRQQVFEFCAGLLALPPAELPQSLAEPDVERPKTLLLLDDAHNLFLATQGGFEGVSAMLELIGSPTHGVFWCLAFNHHSWTYLNSVNARHQYFGEVVHLGPWPEPAIQALILSIHATTAYRISYDDIIQAAGSLGDLEHITYIENRFFSLLRQQSRGNPRLAIHLWLSSLRQVGPHALRVGLPEEPETGGLSELPEDGLFVLASIARHENLTLAQAVAVTGLQEGVVRHVLDLAERMKLLERDANRVYRLTPLYQYPLLSYLQVKRCLYE